MKLSQPLVAFSFASLFSLEVFASIPLRGLPARPTPTAFPHSHGKPHPISPPRDPTKICRVKAIGNGKDDSKSILKAVNSCNHGGTIVFSDPAYTIGTVLDLTFLDSVDIIIQGMISFTPDINYWLANSIKYTYQDASIFWQIGGRDVNIYGGGTVNGNGQVWWDRMAIDSTIRRPMLLGIVGLKGGTVSNLKLANTPNWFQFVANSSDVIFDNMDLSVSSNSSNPVKNSDGWDTYRSDSITIQNSRIYNTDDCVSFKPNSTNIVVQNMLCSGSHGISVGSLGQYVGEVDIVENVYVYNASMISSSDAARIKVWPGIAPGSTITNAGGGTGYVRNVTYDTMHNKGDDYAIELTQCYTQKNQTLCNQNPSSVVFEDITFSNFSGTSRKYDPIVGTLVCSSTKVCKNIVARNINITNPSGKPAKWTCTNIDKSLLDINCG